MDILGFISNITFLSGLCFALGFILVIAEMFHPGFGVFGISGTILLVIGAWLTAKSIVDLLVMLIIIIAILCVMLTLTLKSATNGRLSRILVLHQAQRKEEGYSGSEDLEFFLGKEGTTISILRPAGTADFDGIKLDVVSEGDFIKNESRVKIIAVKGRRIVVREIKEISERGIENEQ
jgi:membrane-bound ClpP family serine protease